MNLASAVSWHLERLERALALPTVSVIHRWLGQSAMLGLVPQLLDGPGPGGTELPTKVVPERSKLPEPSVVLAEKVALTPEPEAGTISILDSDPSQGRHLQWAQPSSKSHNSAFHQMPGCLLCALASSLENFHLSGLCVTRCTRLVGVKRPRFSQSIVLTCCVTVDKCLHLSDSLASV